VPRAGPDAAAPTGAGRAPSSLGQCPGSKACRGVARWTLSLAACHPIPGSILLEPRRLRNACALKIRSATPRGRRPQLTGKA